MGLSQALFSGVSGLIGHQTFLDVIGNNLANVNTVAFKRAVLRFSDLFSQTLSGGTAAVGDIGGTNPVQLGLGVKVAGVSQDFGQGGLQATGNASDLAIEGRGFFIVREGDAYRYTRDGAFHLGTDDTLQSAAGWRLQGTNLDAASGLIPAPSWDTLESIRIPLGRTGGARQTSRLSLAGNLNAAGQVATTGTRAQSRLLLTRTNDGVLAALAAGAGGAAYLDGLGLHVAQADRVRPGDSAYIEGGGVTAGLYTVATVDTLNNILTLVEATPAAATGVTVYMPALASDDLRYTEVTAGGVTGRLGGVYDDGVRLLLGNAATEEYPYVEITALKGDRYIKERFRYGDAAAPGVSSDAEYHGTTLSDLAAFLEDVLGINAASDPDDDRPEILHDGDDGVRDSDLFNEARVVFGRAGALGISAGQSVAGSGWLGDGGLAGSRLYADAGAGTFSGLAAGTQVYISGSGALAGWYRVAEVAADGSYVTLGEAPAVSEDAAGASGATGLNWQLAPSRLYINGNLGTLNHIGSLRVESGATDVDLLEGGTLAAATGESARISTLVYDSTGGSHPLDITLALIDRTDTAATWRWYAECPDDSTYSETANPSPPPPVLVSGRRTDRAVGWGDIVFGNDGIFSRAEPAADGSERVIRVDLRDLAVAQPLTIAPDFAALTQYAAAASGLKVSGQDGAAAGVLQAFAVGSNGIVRGIYSNGVTQDIAQVALADFANVNGLLKEGDNAYIPGVNSGDPVVSSPQMQGLGAVRGSSLELSNVELAEEFSDLIIAQRGFQANARVITTSDEMLSELMNMFR